MGRWGWPATLATMTATAASLLVVLLLRPGPQIVERVLIERVEVPQDDSPEDERSANGLANANDPDARLANPLPDDPAVEPRSGLLASIGLGGPQLSAITRSLGLAHRRQLLDEALASGLDSPPRPPARNVGRTVAPISRRQLLHEMLDGPKPDDSSPRRPATFTLFRRGADS